MATAGDFRPDIAGTLLPDGTRWGEWKEATFYDDAGIFASHKAEVIASGFRWTEGPTWARDTQSLYFSDTIDARIYRWQEGAGTQIMSVDSGGFDGGNVEDFETLFEPGSNGMALHDGWLYICQHPTRRVVRIKLDGLAGQPFHTTDFEVVADASPEGKRLNAPNDVIVAANGDVFFTDPIYGFLKKQPAELGFAYLNQEKGEHPDQPYLDECCARIGAGYTGVYRVRAGRVELITKELSRPNGLALSEDGSLLWVANSHKEVPSWSAFRVRDEAPWDRVDVLDPEALGCDLTTDPAGTKLAGLSDGFKIDGQGRIFSSVMGGICVLDPRGRRVLARVIFGTNISNIQFGDGGALFVTGLGHLWKLQLRV